MFAAYAFLLGWAASNSVVFGEYILNAAEIEPGRWNQRGIGLACLTTAFIIHATALKWGLRLSNFLGVIKLIIILFIIITGWVALAGHTKIQTPRNFSNAFEGTKGSGYSIVMALYNVIWSFIGYSNANYVSLGDLGLHKSTNERSGPERDDESSSYTEDCRSCGHRLDRRFLYAGQHCLLRRRPQGTDVGVWQRRGR
jgi:amino acid transporter